jgi:two-component sensor histidine kinase
MKSEGIVRIVLTQHGDAKSLVVENNGKGLPPDFDLENQSSLGMTLVKSLSSQLGATVEFNNGEWTTFKITF